MSTWQGVLFLTWQSVEVEFPDRLQAYHLLREHIIFLIWDHWIHFVLMFY